MFIPRVHRKNQDPASPRPTRWVGSACSHPLGAMEEERKDGNWNPIYLARLTRAFCPSLSGVPLSPIKVWSPSSRSHKSYVEKEKGKRIRFKMYSPPLIAQLVKNPPAIRRPQFNSWVSKICWRRDRLPTPVFLGFPCGSAGKESTSNAGHLCSIPGLGRSPGEEKGYPLQYSGLENSMDCIVHGVTKSQTGMSDFHFHRILIFFFF